MAPAQCYGDREAAQLRALIPPGTRITLVRGQGQDDRDRYGRLLRYVELDEAHGNTRDVAELLVRLGAARAGVGGYHVERGETY